jgi:hypothetical protein
VTRKPNLPTVMMYHGKGWTLVSGSPSAHV